MCTKKNNRAVPERVHDLDALLPHLRHRRHRVLPGM